MLLEYPKVISMGLTYQYHGPAKPPLFTSQWDQISTQEPMLCIQSRALTPQNNLVIQVSFLQELEENDEWPLETFEKYLLSLAVRRTPVSPTPFLGNPS